jgi:hypothetical protein
LPFESDMLAFEVEVDPRYHSRFLPLDEKKIGGE